MSSFLPWIVFILSQWYNLIRTAIVFFVDSQRSTRSHYQRIALEHARFLARPPLLSVLVEPNLAIHLIRSCGTKLRNTVLKGISHIIANFKLGGNMRYGWSYYHCVRVSSYSCQYNSFDTHKVGCSGSTLRYFLSWTSLISVEDTYILHTSRFATSKKESTWSMMSQTSG